MIKVKLDFEKIFLIIVFGVLLFLGYALIGNYALVHEFPHGFLASDCFIQPGYAEHIKDVGNFRYFPAYGAYGHKDVIGYYPPIPSHLVAIFSSLTGLEVYDTIFFMIVLLTCFGSLIMYYIIRSFNKYVAIFSLALIPLIFYKNFYVSFMWGQWGFLIGSFFLIATFWAISKLNLRKSYILLGLFLSGAALAHTPELIIGIGFIIFYFLVKFIIKSAKLNEIKNVIFAGIICFILSIYCLIIFMYTWMALIGFQLVVKTTSKFIIINLSDFSYLLLLILIGLALALIMVVFNKKSHPSILVGIYMFVIGFGNYFGLKHMAFQNRFFWPIYFAVFWGLIMVYIIKFLAKTKLFGEAKLFTKRLSISSIIIALVIILIMVGTHYERPPSVGLVNKPLWQGLSWFRENTNEDDKIYFFYGDRYGQTAMFYQTKRDSYAVIAKDFIESIKNQTIKRYYKSRGAGGHTFYRTGLFSFDKYLDSSGTYPEPLDNLVMDICNFEYYVFNKVSMQPVLAQYNMVIRDKFLKTGWMEEVYSNELLSILKNNKPGADCIG